MNSYRTIKKATTSESITVKGSKFQAFAYPVSNQTQIAKRLNTLRQSHKNASHYCYAWQLGIEEKIQKTNDDGEPHNSAGFPILGQIFAKELTNILVVVVRYYGGTKLGIGGLISAYKKTAKLTLEQADIIEQTIKKTLVLHCKYEDLNLLMRIIREYNLDIEQQQLYLDCQLQIAVPKSNYEEVLLKFQSLKAVEVSKL